MHDTVIRNARLCDGMGRPLFEGDLAIDAGRIAGIGRIRSGGKEELDAHGLVLAPGIVDLHTHFDAQLTWDPFATPSVALGVTTVVIGNCGFTIAPCKPRDRDLTLRNLTHVEGMSLAALRAGVDWCFESYDEYLCALARKGVVPNVASFVGHSSVRTWVMGEDASKRAASPSEIEQMRQLVLEALGAGAVGFATSTLEQHNGEQGIPMPSRLADEAEMFALTGALGEAGRGVFMLTKGMTTSIPFLEDIASRNKRPVMIAAMFVDPNDPERVFREFDQIAQARHRGRELWGQVGCFPLGMEFSLAQPYPLEALIAWRPAIEAASEAAYQRILADPDFRAAVKAEARSQGVPNRFSYRSLEHMRLREPVDPSRQRLSDRTVAQWAAEAGVDPFDWLLDFVLDGELHALWECKLFNTDEAQVARLLKRDDAAITLSDAGAHLSFLCDAGFGLHLLGHWVRDKRALSLEDGVAAITSRAADVYRIMDRGRLQEGAWADHMLFDPNTIGRGEKRRVHDLPAGASRVDTPPLGLKGVWVNGTQVVDGQGPRACAVRPGQVLRRFCA
jgi:N-acyl-D-aspartate/D-glutamate deacylase